jgi:hypothetical protein
MSAESRIWLQMNARLDDNLAIPLGDEPPFHGGENLLV